MNKIKFHSPVIVSGQEKKLLNKVLISKEWSSFRGSTKNPLKVVSITSKEASKKGPLECMFLGGKYVRKLEGQFARNFNSKFCISANSATSCLSMAVGALDLGPGDEVLLPSMSWISTATSILTFQAIPIFCEVKPDTFCIDPDDIEKRITKRTKAIMIVHLGGNSCDMDKISKICKKHNLKLIEDCAQSPGVTFRKKLLGTFGDIGIFSLTETKNISSGEGGLIITNNKNIAMKCRLIRNHGEGVAEKTWNQKFLTNLVGLNYRMTEFQAAVAIPQLNSLKKRNKERIKLFNYLRNGLKKFKDNLIFPKIEKHTYYVPYMLKWKWEKGRTKISRDNLVKKLSKYGVPTIQGYQPLMHQIPMFSKKIAYKNGLPWSASQNRKIKTNYGTGKLPISENINKKFIWFYYIFYPNNKKHMDYVINVFSKILERK